MVHQEKSFSSNPYLTGQNQLQLTYNPVYPDISNSQWGIDSVSITFLVGIDDYDLSAGWQKAYSRYNMHTGYKKEVDYKGQSIYLYVSLSGRCTVRFNAAKLIHHNPLKLLDPALFLEEIERLLTFLFPYVSSFRIWKKYQAPVAMHSDWLSQINLSRLDLAINLETVTKANLEQLELAKIPRSNMKVVFKIPSRTLTIDVRTKNEGKDQIYDKTHELALEHKIKINMQVHRFETQLRGSRVKKGIKLAQINRTSIWLLLVERWRKAGFEVVQVSQQLIDAILDLEPRIGKSIVNYLKMKQARMTITLSDPTIRKYEKVIKAIQETIDQNQNNKHFLDLKHLFESKKQKMAPVNSDENSE
jgi:hypothetical protein